MQLVINGEPHELETAMNLELLLEMLGYRSLSVAVAVNGHFVPRRRYAALFVQEGQELEIVTPMQGG